MALWETRNSFLHRGKTKASKAHKCEYLAWQIRKQYLQYWDHLPWKYTSLFHLPVEQRIKHGIPQMEIWIQQTTIILNKYDKENGMQTNLDAWILYPKRQAEEILPQRTPTYRDPLDCGQSNQLHNNQRLDTVRQSTISEWLKSWGNDWGSFPNLA